MTTYDLVYAHRLQMVAIVHTMDMHLWSLNVLWGTVRSARQPRCTANKVGHQIRQHASQNIYVYSTFK